MQDTGAAFQDRSQVRGRTRWKKERAAPVRGGPQSVKTRKVFKIDIIASPPLQNAPYLAQDEEKVTEEEEMLASESMVSTPNGAAQVTLSTQVIQQVLGFLDGLDGTGYTLVILTDPSPTWQHIIFVASKMDRGSKMGVYPQQILDQ